MSRGVTVALSDDGSKLVSLTESCTCELWSLLPVSKALPQKMTFRSPTFNSKDAKFFVEFLDNRIFVIVTGALLLLIDSEHMQNHPDLGGDRGSDPAYLIHRVGLPGMARSVATLNGDIVVGGDHGFLYVVNREGRIAQTIRTGINETVTACKSVNGHSLILGTMKGRLYIYSISSGRVTSLLKTVLPSSAISCIAVDPRGNWFSAIASAGSKCKLLSGSARTLVQVFESPLLDRDLSVCEFTQLASKGLCIAATGNASVQVSVFPLDLSAEARNYQEGQGAISGFARASKADIVAIAGSDRPVQILNGSSLSLIRQLVV
jgi:hypothetical protein